MKFDPDNKLNKFQTFIDVNRFIGNINLKKYFTRTKRCNTTVDAQSKEQI